MFNATFNNISVILNPTFQYILWLDRSSRRRNFRERKLSSSVLPTISKFVERAIFDQLTDFFNFYFHPSLSAFRKGFGCQTALLKIIGDWKKALDENKYIAAILMDLSKAFDCLPHDLILLKLEAYGLLEKSINLLNSYLSGRKQCVKVKNMCSSFETVCHKAQFWDPFSLKFLLMTSFTLLILVLYI